MAHTPATGRRRAGRLARRLGVLLGAALIAIAVVLFNSVGVSHQPSGELVGGRADTQSLLLPLLLFVLGMVALAVSLSNRAP